MKLITRPAVKRLGILFGLLLVAAIVAWWVMLRMPGESYEGVLPPAPVELEAELRRDLQKLSVEIGERNVFRPAALAAARDWIESELRAAGYEPKRQDYVSNSVTCSNIEVELPGDDEIVIIGAHYDSVFECPGANDNGTGTVATLAIARRLAGTKPKHTLRFVFFVNEEPPHFRSELMGSFVYARRCRERDENIVAMISVETIGYFTDEPDSQVYPIKPLAALYGSTGNFVAFVGDVASASQLRQSLAVFREHTKIPSRGAALMRLVPGIDRSDQWSFWQHGYPGFMVTDTAPFRYPHYHKRTDTPDKVRFDCMALIVEGLVPVVEDLAGISRPTVDK